MSGFGRSNTRAGKLNPEKVRQLRERYAMGETQNALGKAFGISTNQVGRIVRGESWGGFEGRNNGGAYRNALAGDSLEEESPPMSPQREAEVKLEIEQMLERRKEMARLQSGGTYLKSILGKTEVGGILLAPDFVPDPGFEEVKAPDAEKLLDELKGKQSE